MDNASVESTVRNDTIIVCYLGGYLMPTPLYTCSNRQEKKNALPSASLLMPLE